MEVFIERDSKTIEIKLENEILVKKLLEDLNVSLESVIIVKNGSICLEEETLSDKDKVKILSVVSGG